MDPLHACHAGRARLDQVVLRIFGTGRLRAIGVPEAEKGSGVSLIAWLVHFEQFSYKLTVP